MGLLHVADSRTTVVPNGVWVADQHVATVEMQAQLYTSLAPLFILLFAC